jgi:putative tricarboxylic transport membrane protein
MFDVLVMLIVSVASYVMQLHKLPAAPLLLAYVLFPMLERYIAAALGMSSGRLYIFFHNPMCIILALLIVAFCVAPLIIKLRDRKKESSVKH